MQDLNENVYHSIVSKSPIGYAYHKIILDEYGEPCNFEYVDINPAYEEITGLKSSHIIGKDVLQVMPNFIGHIPEWIALCGNVAQNAETQVIEHFFDVEKKWYLVTIYALEKGYFVTNYQDITDKYKLISESEKERERIANVLEGTNVGTWEWYIQTGETEFDERWAQMLGYTLEEISPVSIATWEAFTHPDDMKIAQASLEKTFNKEIEYYDVEFRMLHKDGSYVWVHDRGKVTMWAEDGTPLRLSGSHTDITEKMAAQQAMEEAEWKFTALFEKGPIGVAYHQMIYDDTGKAINYYFIDANVAYQELTGVKPVGKTILEAFPGIENDPFDWIGTFGKVAKSGQDIRFEQYLEFNNRWYDVVAYQYKPDHFVAAFINITDRKLAERAILEEKERLAVTLRSIGDGVITTDINGDVLIMNKIAEILTGWKQDEALGKPITTIFNIINETTREAHENPVQIVISSGAIMELENHTVLIARDGTERPIADSGAPIMDKDSNIIGVVLVFRDMTEKQKIYENIQRIDKLDSLGVLAGGIAHDFNNLLGGIFGYIEMARSICDEDSQVSRHLDKALNVFERAKDLTQQLLTFSKGG
ncbi:MAG: PAS domain S-box protein, partial [Vallitaleaceae bacterium]|nr:PAS domain S-box protein [Vallitaleaceae bacterium]